MISNYITESKGRIDSDKDISREKRDELIKLARDIIGYTGYIWNANINGIVIQLRTNSFHLYDFWVDNWFPGPSFTEYRPHGQIYAVMGVPNHKPFAYYHQETKTAIFINTEYYGQCKSWALGIAADIMEQRLDIHSIHGACVDVGGKGVVIVAPTGTGKSTHSYELLELKDARIHSDDWLYVKYIGGPLGRASGDISERNFYMRTDIVKTHRELKPLFEKSKCENVKDNDFTAFGNSRVMLNPFWLGGSSKFIMTTRIKVVFLLRRDNESPPEVKLNPDEAIEILEEGKYQVLAGAGDDVGSFKYEPWYNPYLLVRNEERTKLQEDFFRKLFNYSPCYILNTGVENIEQSQERIRRIIRETK